MSGRRFVAQGSWRAGRCRVNRRGYVDGQSDWEDRSCEAEGEEGSKGDEVADEMHDVGDEDVELF